MKVLLIDDDAFFRALMGKALDKQGYETVLACDGQDVLEKIENDILDLIITDLFMPNKEGLEVIQEIRVRYPSINIIAMSSDGPAGYSSFLKMAQAIGANAILKKPFGPEMLIKTINELFGPAPSVRTAV
jgi:CheY-like chemotaxis protein